jgi:hypothetical protein
MNAKRKQAMNSNTDQAMADKILKLLTLADDDGATDAEAKAARKKALVLLEKYNLTRDDLTRSQLVVRSWDSGYSRTPGWYKLVIAGICEIMGIYAVYSSGTFQMAGRSRDIDQSTYMAEQIRTQVFDLCAEWGEKEKERTGSKPGRADFNSYRTGLAKGVYERLCALVESANIRTAGEEGLVRKRIERRRQEGREKWREENPNVRIHSAGPARHSGCGAGAGMNDAGKVNISRGVGNSRGGARKSLSDGS